MTNSHRHMHCINDREKIRLLTSIEGNKEEKAQVRLGHLLYFCSMRNSTGFFTQTFQQTPSMHAGEKTSTPPHTLHHSKKQSGGRGGWGVAFIEGRGL